MPELERQLLRVERAYSGSDLTRPKSEAGRRAVPIFPSARKALVGLMDLAIDYGRFDPETEILLSPRGKPIHSSNFYRRVWRPALDSVGLDYRWNDLRHTCVSRLVAEGADVALVQAVAGHSDPRITLQRYTHLREARVTEAAERFAGVFSR